MTDRCEPEIVTQPPALAELCRRLRAAGCFAFDTEFVGEDNYRSQVCLIQVATKDHTALIDPVAGLDVKPFWLLVADPDVRTLVHAGAEDLSLCRDALGTPPANVFDLQLAAGLVGLGYPTSLLRLARSALGVRIHKSQTLTDWRKRPLSAEQIEYAVDDVRHLPRLYDHIRRRLSKHGRQDWAEEECARLCGAATIVPDQTVKIRRVRGSGSLSRRELAIAEALAVERERLAEEYDRPPRAVLRDHLLVELARHGWTSISRMRTLRGLSLSAPALRRLAEVIEKAKRLPQDQWPEQVADDETAEEGILIALCGAILRDHCNRNDLAYSLLASKQDVREFVCNCTRPDPPPKPILLKTGWRKTVAGDLLDGFLSGQCALQVKAKGREHRLVLEKLR